MRGIRINIIIKNSVVCSGSCPLQNEPADKAGRLDLANMTPMDCFEFFRKLIYGEEKR